MNIPESRDVFGSWLNNNGLVHNGVEVGALSGVFSEKILSQWSGERLYLIDPWETQPIDIYREDDGRFNHHAAYEQACDLSRKDPRAILLKGLSCDVVHTFSNETMDFVYIDANHAYEYVKQDMDIWWPKVKPGGMLCGHDFYNCTTHPFYNEVERAVNEWTSDRNVKYWVTNKCSSWWIPK